MCVTNCLKSIYKLLFTRLSISVKYLKKQSFPARTHVNCFVFMMSICLTSIQNIHYYSIDNSKK